MAESVGAECGASFGGAARLISFHERLNPFSTLHIICLQQRAFVRAETNAGESENL